MPHEYGPWLRAMPFNPGKTPFTVVSGMGDGLEGATKSSNKPTETAVRSSEMNMTRPDPGEKEGADRMQHPDMETSETKALLMQKSQKISTPLNKESTPGFEDQSQLGASNITDLINLAHEKRKNVDLMAMV
nr:hypothetical protein CFP56_18349 [Quercus suber]